MFIPPPDFTPDFSKAGGLVAAVAQDAASGEVLMLAWMDRTAWEATLATGEAHYFSRSRRRLWHKGESSGHVQKVKAVRLDCDADAGSGAGGRSGLSRRLPFLLFPASDPGGRQRGRRHPLLPPRLRPRLGIRFLIPFPLMPPQGVCSMSAPAFPSLSSQLKLGIPKGSLEEATISLFDRAG